MTEANFAHAAEVEVAHLLTFWGVRWEYEPHTFPLCEDADGRVTESFSPDFWLPDEGTYLEVTTERQANSRLKHRKVRRFRERYPELRVVLYELHDIEALLLKSGQMDRAGEVLGAGGQLN